MKFDTFSQKEGVGETVMRDLPGFGNGWDDIEILVELNQSIKYLLDDRNCILVDGECWIEGFRAKFEWLSVNSSLRKDLFVTLYFCGEVL